MAKPKAVRVLQWLLSGFEVQVLGLAMPLEAGEKEDGTPVIGFRMTRQTLGSDEPPQEFIMDADISLNEFIALVERMSDDDLFIMGSQFALTEMNRERADARDRWVAEHRGPTPAATEGGVYARSRR